MRFFSLSFTARSYSLCSSVLFGALTPIPAAIIRDAVAVDVSGLLSPLADVPGSLLLPPLVTEEKDEYGKEES